VLGVNGNVVGLVGGLGNQLFQYAFARWLEQRTGLPSHLDVSAYRRRPDYFNLPALPLRRLPVVRAVAAFPHPLGRLPRVALGLRRVLGPRSVFREGTQLRFPSESDLTSPAWYYGYWQHSDVVADVLDDMRDELGQGSNAGAAEPIAMHVRRGDMTAHVSALDGAYYPRALQALREANGLDEATPVAVYSDDPAWCREELSIPGARYVIPGDAATDLLALSRHRLLVLSGSTFSWWAAALGPRARHAVAAPDPFSMVPGQRLENPQWLAIPRTTSGAR
jgi:Glycosyl transferase family 11